MEFFLRYYLTGHRLTFASLSLLKKETVVAETSETIRVFSQYNLVISSFIKEFLS